MERIEIKLAGYRKKYLVCDAAHCSCGDITDGVSFFFSDGRGEPFDGCWLMSFEDLKRVYEAVAPLYKAGEQP